MKFKNRIFIVFTFALALLGSEARTQVQPRPIFASELYNGTGHLYVPSSTPLANRACLLDNSSTIAGSITTSTELSYVHGVTSNIQDQIDAFSGGAVSSVFGRTGAVTAQSGDYSSFYLLKANDLSDLPSASTARANLGLGTAATQPSSAFDAAGSATAAQAAAEAASDPVGSAATAQAAAEAASDPVGSAATAQAAAQASSLQKVNNLSDLTSMSTARSNLGLGSAATHAATDFDASGSAAAAQAASLQKANNLSDLASASAARTNLGLGSAATQPASAFDASGSAAAAQAAAIAASDPLGSAATAQAASLQKTANLSDLTSASIARSNLGLGSAATHATGDFLLSNNIGNLTDAGTDGITVTNGTNVVIGTGTSVAQHVADATHNGYLGSADWSIFSSKQPAGNYITGLTGDVTAAGPGSVAATIQALSVTNSKIANSTIDLTAKVTGLLPNANVASIPVPLTKYINFNSGSDVACPANPCGDGSSMRPWYTLNHAYASVIDESVNNPYVFIISGGNNDPDTGTINAKPNIALYAPYQIQISQPFVVGPDDVPGIGNDVLNYTNITFLFGFSFVKNDASLNTIFVVNTEFNSGPTIKQNGSGWMFIDAFNVTTNNADFKLGDTGAIFFNPYFIGTTTFEDATSSAYYQFMGGYLGGPLSITGAPFVYSSGLMIDVPFGATWTNVHSANGDPTIQFDSAGLPPSVTGAYSSVFTSFSQYVGYTPATSSQWSPVPSNVGSALDQLAARPSGGGGRTTNTVTTGITVPTLTQDYILNVNSTSGILTETLPSAIASDKWCIDIKNIGSPVHNVTVATQSAQTIDGASTLVITDRNDDYRFCAVNGEWFLY